MGHCPVFTCDPQTAFPAPALPPVDMGAAEWRNGMVVRMPNHLGDAIMALPALGLLKSIIPPHCALYVIAPEYMRQLFDSIDCVDGCVSLSRVHCCWSQREFIRVHQLRMGVGVLFSNSFRDALMMRIAGVKSLFGYSARSRGFLLRAAFRIPARPSGALADVHHANIYSAIARAMGATGEAAMPKFTMPCPTDELCPPLPGLCLHPRLMTIASGAAYGAAKRWPSDRFREVAAAWIASGGIVAVVGNVTEHAIGQEVIDGLDNHKVFNLCGDTSVVSLMQLLRHSRVVVANDSGVMHLAAAMGTPGVAVFGPTDYTSTGPVGGRWHMAYDKMECSPCYKRACPKGNQECIRRITARHVIDAVEAIAPARS